MSPRIPLPPCALVPVLDGAGVALVRVPGDAVHARLDAPDHDVFEVDVEDGVRSLDLRGLSSEASLRLVVRCTTSLERLDLPRGEGTRLTLVFTFPERQIRCADLDDGRQPGSPSPVAANRGSDSANAFVWPSERGLAVQGRLASFDLAWPGPDGAMRGVEWRARNRKRLEGLQIGPLGAEPCCGLDGWVVIGGTLARKPFAHPTPFLWIVDAQAPAGIAFSDDRLEWVELSRVATPSLAFGEIGRLWIRPCAGLERVSGDTPRLLLRQIGAVERLELEGSIGEADLIDVRCRTLTLLGCSRLRLERVRGLERLESLSHGETLCLETHGATPELVGQVRVRVRTPTPRDIDAQFEGCGVRGKMAMLGWADEIREGRDIETALRVYSAAIDWKFLPAEDLWEHRWNLHRRLSAAGYETLWAWPFPDDGALRGYETDVYLWLRLLAEAPARARTAAARLAMLGSPAHFASLAFVAASPGLDPAERDALLGVAAASLENGCARASQLRREHGPRAVWDRWEHGADRDLQTVLCSSMHEIGPSRLSLGFVDTAIHALLALAHLPLASATASRLAAWLALALPDAHGIRALGRLRTHGCAGADEALESVRTALLHELPLDPAESARLVALAASEWLRPDASPRFADFDPSCLGAFWRQ